MAEVVQNESRGHKGGKKKKRRLGVRMDMTPMVDVAFLLLTFFMLSTSLVTPQVMEITLPPDTKATMDIGESNLLTLKVRRDQNVFWYMGSDSTNMKKASYSDLYAVLRDQLRRNPKLATLIKIDRGARYQALVDMIDELNITQARLGMNEKRFSILSMDDAEYQRIANL